MPQRLLSKSKYLIGLQCPRLLWIEFHEPERIPEVNTATQFIFDQGNLVGELAKQLFPTGIDLSGKDFMDNIRQTNELIGRRKPLFEAGILAGQIYSRIDILNPHGENNWDIIEVKSSTSIKDVHIDDVSFQLYCCEQLGLNINKCYLIHLNKKYTKAGEINPKQLLVMEDISDRVEEVKQGIWNRIDDQLDIISAMECPEIVVGSHCSDPYACSLTDCWENLPEHHVFTLYSGGERSTRLYSLGVNKISDIPADFKLSNQQQIQRACVITGIPHINVDELSQFLSSLEYPLYYLDFETIGPAVPMFDGTHPYQNIPFQFSLHVVRNLNSDAEHFSFLASGTEDPRPLFLDMLRRRLGDTGSIVVYNQSFEEGILRESGMVFPDYTSWVDHVSGRMVDLLVPFRRFHYYHPRQKGSASLKRVLPAITRKSYKDMEITDGSEASVMFYNITYGEATEGERNRIRAALEKYCLLDTEGMIWIVERLQQICS